MSAQRVSLIVRRPRFIKTDDLSGKKECIHDAAHISA